MATSSPSHDISQEIPESERDITEWARNHKDIFKHDIVTLRLQTELASNACKKLSKEQENIERKSHREQSKELHGCIAKYGNYISVLRTACKKISEVVDKKNTEVPRLERRLTYDGRGKKRKNFPSFKEQCQRQDDEIIKLESDLKRKDDDVREKIAAHTNEITGYKEELNRKDVEYQANRKRMQDDKDELLGRLQMEIDEKEDVLRRSNEEMEEAIIKHEQEIRRKEEEYQENQKRMQDENESLRSLLQIESEAKEDALRRTKEMDKQIVTYEGELKRKEAEFQEKINTEVKRKVAENEEETKKIIWRFEEERKRKETEFQERMHEVTKRLHGQLQIHIEAKEADLRRIQEAEKQISLFEVELKRKDAECQENEKRMQLEKESFYSQLQMESVAKEDAQRRTEDANKTIEDYVEEFKRKEAAYREICRINDDMKRKIQNLEEETIRNVKRHEEEISRKELVYQESRKIMDEEMERLSSKLQTEINAKEDALRRFSSMASSKLRDNNPNITDLSDQNRPTKIAEKLSELYDNQWTDAFDALDDSMSEREIIQTLLDTLMKVYEECCKLSSENFYERIQNCIESPIEQMNKPSTAVVLPEQLKQQIKEFRKTRAALVVQDIEKVITSKLQISSKQLEEIKGYISKCVWIGWFCAVQDPPLILSVSSSTQFDTNVFKEYTERGPYVQFVVWPALLLHAQGALLCKGIAQGGDRPPENKTSLA